MARRVGEGSPGPLGVTPDARGANVAVYSANATAIELCLFDQAGDREIERIRLPDRTGDVFHGHVEGLAAGARYGLRAHGPYAPTHGHRFNAAKLLVDPYAQAIDRPYRLHPSMFGFRDGDPFHDGCRDEVDSAPYVPKGIVGLPGNVDGGIRHAWPDTIIYELHVRGFTKRHPGVAESIRGTFAGLASPKSVEHLVRLGVSSIEIMPAVAWIDERHLPELGLTNYWGYNPVTMIAPDPRLAPGGWAEIADAVAILHSAGIEVILDVVLNHSGESDELGPTISFRGLDNATYYRLRAGDLGRYANDTGCGNCLALDRPPVIRMAMDSLRAWVRWTGIDGLRFDLATAMGRRDSGFDPAAPLLAAIDQDPLLRDIKLIAEPWDIGPGGYQVGAFPPNWGQWNDKFRDGVRRFWRGDGGRRGDLATRLAGSSDTLGSRARPSRNANFITAHDGFTLADLVSYTSKRNQANGEGNRDGTDENVSWNNGAEGPTDDPAIVERRARDQRNLLATVLLARGSPMIAMGSELGHSQAGNNNAYAQDNEGSWLDWAHADTKLAAFAARLVAVRKAHPALRGNRWLTGEIFDASGLPDVEWRSAEGPLLCGSDWGAGHGDTLIAVMAATDGEARSVDRVVLVFNASRDALSVALPEPRDGFGWQIALDTASDEPLRLVGDSDRVEAQARSVLVLEEVRTASDRRPRPVDPAILDRLARTAGIAPEWWDEEGGRHLVSDATKRALLTAMSLPAGTTSQARESLAELLAQSDSPVSGREPARCHLPEWLRHGKRRFGVSAQLYALRRPGDQGIGDFSTLAQFAERTARAGGATVGFNPFHMMFHGDRERASPYHPSDRRFLDPIYIDLSALDDRPGAGPAVEVGASPDLVDYTLVWSLKRAVLEGRFSAFDLTAHHQPDVPLVAAFNAFVAEGGETLRRFAIHEAIAENTTGQSWHRWPAELRDPAGAAVAQFATAHESRVRFHSFLQFLADRQFAAAAARARHAGLELGFYRDLAVGAAPDGAEAWATQAELAQGAVVGAPPDRFSADGQVWNLTPAIPFVWRRTGYRAFRELIAANMRHAGALRIDHVMGITRLFWIPEGARPADGAYVSYPVEDLLSHLARESVRHKCMVVGEDLGTVPDGLRDRLAAADILSYRVLWFEREGDAFKPPSTYPAKAVACVSTHDLPTLAGWWEGADFAERHALGQINVATGAKSAIRRRAEKETLAHSLIDAGLLTSLPDFDAPIAPEFVVAVLSWVAGSPCSLVLAQADDLAGERIATNLPGTDRERPNWRRRLAPDIESLFESDLTKRIFERLRASRSG